MIINIEKSIFPQGLMEELKTAGIVGELRGKYLTTDSEDEETVNTIIAAHNAKESRIAWILSYKPIMEDLYQILP